MDEELIDYFFGIAQKEGFKKTREDFVKYVQTDDELFDYLYGKAQKEGYKKDKNHFSGLVGRGANQPVQEPAKTETVTETVTEESPMAAKEPISMPTKFSAREVSETVEPSKVDLTNKEKSDRLSDVTEAKKKAMAEDMSSKLIPVTEKTQVKEVVEEKKKAEVPTDIKVKEVVKEEPVKEVKIESKSNMPSYDDLGINPEKDPGAFMNLTFDKNTKYNKLSPSELINKDIFKNINNIELERNVSLKYPDPPNINIKKSNIVGDVNVFKPIEIKGEKIYSSYDDKNKKWYIFQEGSDKNNWTEVKSPEIKTMLNANFIDNSGKVKKDKIDFTEDDMRKINFTRNSIMINKYLPYIMKNYDNLSKEDKLKLEKDLKEGTFYGMGGYEMMLQKYLLDDDPNVDLWLKINDKFLNNQLISSTAINISDNKIYKSEYIEVPQLNKDIKENKIKPLKSIAGDVFYDEKNDIIYYNNSFDRKKLSQETTYRSTEDNKDVKVTNGTYFKVIKKGTPVYDKIKNSLDKYNK